MHDRTYSPDVESTGFAKAGLPDDPNLEMEVASRAPTGWFDAVCQGCGAAIFIAPGWEPLCSRCQSDDGPTCGGAALFPEIPTWTDEQLVVAIELADRREPGLAVHPDRHEVFLDACSAELVRRLEERGVRFAV